LLAAAFVVVIPEGNLFFAVLFAVACFKLSAIG